MNTRVLLILWCSAVAFSADVPRTWNDKDLAEWATPVTGINVRPGHFSEKEYYAAPTDDLRTYPVYHPDREPAGYWESLQKKKPERMLDPSKLKTQSDWIAAGRRVWDEMDVPGFRTMNPKFIAWARSKQDIDKSGVYVQKDGTLFPYRWAVTEKGVALTINECSACHKAFLDDGTVVNGAGFNRPFEGPIGGIIQETLPKFFPGDTPSMTLYRQFGVPWLKDDIHEQLKTMTGPEMGELFATQIPGVIDRFNGSVFYMTKVLDLVGIRDRKYMDSTATHRHRGIGDLMRYAALVGVADSLDFGAHRMLTDEQRTIPYRFSDEALYALAQYIYSLEPPANPNKFDDRAAAGKKLFERENCQSCHPAPLYTNNKLTPAWGFTPPAAHKSMLDIMTRSASTDSNLALKTRKATGYYKIPPLKGVWYRGLFMHDGSLAKLEEMFDPKRLKDDYVPSGFKGYRVKQRAVPGHEYGIKLNPEERGQLVAFLHTL